MIRILKKPKVIVTMNCGEEYVYDCPSCKNPIKWNVIGALSPFYCTECRAKQMDMSLLVRKEESRINYHLNGEGAVSCGGSALV